MSLQDTRDLVDSLVREPNGRITPEDRDRAIGLAVMRYSTDRPRTALEDLTSSGGQALPLPTAWESGFSSLSSVEFPIDLAPPVYLESAEFGVYRRPSGEVIILAQSLTAGDLARVQFTLSHALTEAEDSIPAPHREAVAHYAAASLCDQLAAAHSGDSDPTIQADRLDQSNPARQWALRARTYRDRYAEILGIPKGAAQGSYVPPAGTVTNIDLKPSWGRGRLFKRR